MEQIIIEEKVQSAGNKLKAGKTLSLRERIMKYFRYLPLFIICVFTALLISYLYLRYTTPVYEVVASLFIKKDNKFGGSSNEEFSSMMFFNPGNDIENEIEILKSNSMMKRVVSSLGLQYNYHAVGKVKMANTYKSSPFALQIQSLKDSATSIGFKVTILDDTRFAIENIKQELFFNQTFQTAQGSFKLVKNDSLFREAKYKEYLVSWAPPESAAGYFAGALAIKPVNLGADVLRLTYVTDNRKMGEDILNQLMIEYSEADLEEKNMIASRTLDFINERIGIIFGELDTVERNLQRYKEQNRLFNIEEQSGFYLENLKDIEQQLQEQEIKIEIVKMLEDFLSKSTNKYEIVTTSLGLEAPTLQALTARFNELQFERTRQVKSTTPDNIFVKRLEEDIEKARSGILQELATIRRSFEVARNDIRQRNQSYQSQIRAIPSKEKQLLDISRQQGIKQALYIFLGQKREETAITRAANISNSKIVDPAMASGTPKAPNRKSIYVIALTLGLLIPVAIIYIRELLNDKITVRNDIENSTSVPILGEVGHSDTKNIIVVGQNSRKIIAEQFRILRTNLGYLLKKDEKPVILVTSSFSGEGKSFISANLAAVLSLADKKTIILEFDIRKPKVASGLNLSISKGITSYLLGHSEITDIIRPVEGYENLFVMPCGFIPPNPAEILLNERIKTLFDYVKEHFDAVIVDSAPAGLVSDAFILGNYANCTLYIVRQRYTFKRQISSIEELAETKKLPRMNILVNDVKAEGTGYYGYGNYGYGYGHGYGYGATAEIENRSWWSKLKSYFFS